MNVDLQVTSWPADELESVPNCPVCGSGEREVLHRDLTDRVFGVAPGIWTLYRCCGCHSAWLDPRPTPASIGRAYASYYTHDDQDYPVVRRRGVVRRFLHDAVNGYLNSRYRMRREPSLELGRWLIPLLPPLKSAADADFRHLPLPPIGGGVLLDVGCGNGCFLLKAKEMGWRVEGIDPDPISVEAASRRGLDVYCGGIELLADVSERYDVITMAHVLEHVYEPAKLLGDLHRLLKPGGRLWLETPNIDSLGYERYGGAWRGLEPPRHLVLFTQMTVRNMLHHAGFAKIKTLWRGLIMYSIFAASEAIENNGDARSYSRNGVPGLRDLFAELTEVIDPGKREFITLLAYKK